MHVASEGDTPPAVLVTGASTGIGRAVATLLARRGFAVFAGVRQQEAAERLAGEGASAQRSSPAGGAQGSITPVRFDVTDREGIARAAAEIDERVGERGLHGVVNNAGMVVAGPLEFLPLEDLRLQLEVNVIGQIAVTQAMLPLLRRARQRQLDGSRASGPGVADPKPAAVGVRSPQAGGAAAGASGGADAAVRGSHGRVVFVGSISGLVASRLLGAYAASKFAIEALGDAFRLELAPWGMQVAIVEPGRVRTPIWDKTLGAGQARLARMPDEAAELYDATIRAVAQGVTDVESAGIAPDGVARAVLHALSAPRARTRYRVGFDAHVVALLTRLLPDRWLDRFLLVVKR
ncbi:MAG: SDR family NAD(P)-dependent oxidoreductase [Deinococcales bacterium]